MTIILGLESSCDDSAAALVTSDRQIIAQAVVGQNSAHQPYGGVVPEIAARAHVEILPGLIEQVVAEAKLSIRDIDAVAATAGPGLIGGVMVALLAGKGLALATGKPLVAVNHLEGHALSPRLADPCLDFPYLLLLVSGGHCQLLEVRGVGDYHRLATTIDDAAGEAFDKAAKLLGLPYPGGPAVEELAKVGDPKAVPLPRPLVGSGEPHFSFAGLKSAVQRAVASGDFIAADIAASFQQAAVDCLVDRTRLALEKTDAPTLVVAGGVAANQAIRSALADLAEANGRKFSVPPQWLCTDNAAMIAWAGAERFATGETDPLDVPARARWPLDQRREGARGGGQSVKLGVIGGGAWGTALAQVASAGGRETLLWALEPEVVEGINTAHENAAFLPGVPLNPAIRATDDFSKLADCDAWLVVTPAQHMRSVLERAADCDKPLLLCSKGIEERSGELLNHVAKQVCPRAQVAVLSGPTFAHEVAKGLPTAVTLAAEDPLLAERLRDRIKQPTFRIYVSDDLAGAEIGGAVKNVLAIACGVVEGKGLGQNARAALIGRGFAEMTRFGLALGAKRETLAGLSGLGDLVLTCSSTNSRNYSLGVGIGQGRSAAELMSNRKTVAEGAFTAPVLARLAREKGIDMPIVDAVDALIAGHANVDQVLDALLARPPKPEGV